MSAAELLPLIRELFSRNPEYRDLEPGDLAWLLFSLRYADDLENEYEIAAAVEVARADYPQWRPAA